MGIRLALLAAIAATVVAALAVMALPGQRARADVIVDPLLPPLTGITVAVDPGHNGGNASHPSAINRTVPAGGFRKACDTTGTATGDSKLSESAFTWSMASRVKRKLEKLGATVVLTRANDRGVGPCINRRAKIGNDAKAAVALSIHADGAAPGGRGFHVIRPGTVKGYTEPIVAPSRDFAVVLRDALSDAGLKTSNYLGRRGLDRRTDLGGLNLSKIPKVFVELGNMRNAGDARRMKRGAWRDKVAVAIVAAITAYLTPPAN